MSTPIASRLSGSLAALLLLPAVASPQQPQSPAAAGALAPTSVVLTIASPTTMYYGESVDGSAEVSSSDGTAPTGTITFYDGAVNICSLQIAAGASCPASAGEGFAAGTHVLTAVYSGDATHAASSSNTATITVLQDTTSARLTSSLNPAISGQNVTFTATIQGAHATPTGSVIFYDGTSPLATAPLDATGTAKLPTSTLSSGTHSITAVFAAAANFTSSTSAPVSEQIQPAVISVTPSFSIAVNSVSVEAGQSVAIPVVLSATTGGSITLACGDLPEEATCSFLPGSKPSLVLNTSAPRDCGSTTPYGTANLSLAAPLMAGLVFLLVPRRRSPLRGLFAALIVASALGAMTGCGTGNCTDLGTRPGTYTITVTGTAPGAVTAPVTKQIVVKVTI